jgi:hypothetical protein
VRWGDVIGIHAYDLSADYGILGVRWGEGVVVVVRECESKKCVLVTRWWKKEEGMREPAGVRT